MIGFFAFLGLIISAWFARRGGLVEQIERRGIHMTSRKNLGRSGPKTIYFVRKEDVPKLQTFLTNSGFKLDPTYGSNMNIYQRKITILGLFRPNSQRAVLWNEVEPGTDRQVLALYLDNEFSPDY